MPKYQFRLKTLLKVRQARRDAERARLAEAYQAEQVLTQQRAAIEDEREELRGQQRMATAGKVLDVNRLAAAQRYELVLRAQAQTLSQQVELLATETEKRRQQLVDADREVRVLEKLDQRQREEHRLQAERTAAKQLDEVATQRSWLHRPASRSDDRPT